MKRFAISLAGLVLLAVLTVAAHAETPVVEWTRQLGTNDNDSARGVSVDNSGNVYVAGRTGGDLDGNTSAGYRDMFLVKYDTGGNKLWTKLLGTNSLDYGWGVSVDGSGNVYVAGDTYGDLDGNTNAGLGDMFLVKYDTGGNKQWTKQLGTGDDDNCWDVSVDSSGNAYVAGSTEGGLDGNTNEGGWDMFLVKYDTTGTKLWTEQLGTGVEDWSSGVSVDSSGNAYVTGYTLGGLDGNINAGGEDVFLVKISAIPEPGDANGDGNVNEADATILAGNWQKTIAGGYSVGDFDEDGDVDDLDATIMAANWRAGTSASVPEPGTITLLLCGLAGLALLRRRW